MKKSDFDRLLERYLNGKVTDRERARIEAWLDVMKTRDTTNLELGKADEDRLFKAITDKVENADEIISGGKVRGKKATVRKWFAGIAATLLILLSVSYGIRYITGNAPEKLHGASNNMVEKVILNDGSLVWLRGKSRLVYYQKMEEGIRYATLEGEALFEIAKDAAHPFVIDCGEATIRVVGTSFSVRTGGDSLELKVLTGRVNLSSKLDKTQVDVAANEKVIYSVSGGLERLELKKTEVVGITSDTEYSMEFNNVPLDDVMERVSDKFNIQIELLSRQVGKCRITADFTDHSLESTLQMLSEVLDVEYQRKNNRIQVRGSGCQ
jgi:ferric-dicitrate binding protein FerR (iron transport regulator)